LDKVIVNRKNKVRLTAAVALFVHWESFVPNNGVINCYIWPKCYLMMKLVNKEYFLLGCCRAFFCRL